MFETSVIQGAPRAAGGRFSLLTMSIIAHSAVIVGAVVISVATVKFPSSAPDEYAQAPIFMPVMQIPPPLGVPNGGAPRQPEPAQPAVPPPPAPTQETAPAVVPDNVVQAEAPTVSDSNSNGNVVPGATSTEPRGQSWGTEGSVGDLDAPPGPMPAQTPVEEKIYQPHEVKAPVAIFKPAPAYPQALVKTRLSAVVVVRCIIDKNGHVREPRVVSPAPMAPFNDAVVATVQRWRFTPGSLRGVAVESYLDLTVRFSVN
jgi:protein TonB